MAKKLENVRWPETEETNVQPVEIVDEVRSSMLQYGMSVLVGRALPDVRDGMKPGARRILYAMYEDGLVHSKPFRKLLGCTGNLEWGESIKEIIWNLCPTHPIAEGIPKAFELEADELYSEPFFIPKPDDLIFGGWYEHGNIFRSGATWTRGLGKIFYFQPGHEDCPAFYNPYVQKIITNAVRWAKPNKVEVINKCPYSGEGFLKMPEPKYFD